MEDFRSKSYADGGMQMEAYDYNNPSYPTGFPDFRCYSASYASSSPYPPPSVLSAPPQNRSNTQIEAAGKDMKFKKGKSAKGWSSSSFKGWSLSDPELQRKKRVASYRVYSVEGKVKGSLRKSFRWLKDRCSQVVYGWRCPPEFCSLYVGKSS